MEGGTSTNAFRKARRALVASWFSNDDIEPIRVLDNIFIGTFGAANNLASLKHHNITHIVCVSDTLAFVYSESFEYLRISVADHADEDISSSFDSACHFIHTAVKNGGNVLVHCFAGRSRSATIVIAYLIAHHNMTLQDAIATVRRDRPTCRPNSGFMKQLREYEARLDDQKT